MVERASKTSHSLNIAFNANADRYLHLHLVSYVPTFYVYVYIYYIYASTFYVHSDASTPLCSASMPMPLCSTPMPLHHRLSTFYVLRSMFLRSTFYVLCLYVLQYIYASMSTFYVLHFYVYVVEQ
jgi:hypothetical protein